MKYIYENAFKNCSSIKTITLPASITSIGYNSFNGVGTASNPAILINKSKVPSPTSSTTDWKGGYFVLSNVLKASTSNGSFSLSANNVSVKSDGSFTDIVDAGAEVTIVPVPDFGYVVDTVSYSIAGNAGSATCTGPDTDGKYSFTMPDTDKIVTVSITFKSGPAVKLDGFTFQETDSSNGVAIAGYDGSDSNVSIPEKVTYYGREYTVTEIGEQAFYQNNALQTVTIPNSVTAINKQAFCQCENLQSVIIPDSVTSIGVSAFDWCKGLKKVILGKGLKTIGDNAFNGVGRVNSTTIVPVLLLNKSPDITGPTSSEEKWYGGYFKSVFINVIKESATNGNFSLSANNVSTDTDGNLTDVVENGTVVTITPTPDEGYQVDAVILLDESGTYSITCSGPDSDGKYSFTMPDADIIIKVSVTFKVASKVTSDGYAFEFVDDTNPSDGVYIKGYNGSARILTIPGKIDYIRTEYTVKSIGKFAFDGKNIQSVSIPDSVITIDDAAFNKCKNLESITIPNSVKTIGDGAFSGCISLKSVTLPESLTAIGDGAFLHCMSIESITIPSSVTEIGTGILDCCYKLRQVVNESEVAVYYSDRKSWYYMNGDDKVIIDDGWLPAKTTAYVDKLSLCRVVDASLSIGDNIGVNLYMDLPVNVAKNGIIYINDIKYVIPAPDANDLYKFTTWTNAKNFDDDIEINVYDPLGYGVPFSNGEFTFTYNVRTYINEAKKSEDANMKALAEALDLYGYCAQDYFGYNAPATTPVVDTSADLSSYAMTSTGTLPEGLRYFGSTLLLKRATTIRHYFRADEGSLDDYTFKCGDNTLDIHEYVDMFYVEIPGIVVTDLARPYAVTITKKSDEESTYTMNYSALTYCNKAGKSYDDKLKRLVYSLYNFYKASDAYVKSKK